MFTPSSTASTAPGPAAAASGSRTSTAGRLLIRLASTAASAAMPSRASRPVPSGRTWPQRVGEPVVDDRAHDDAQREDEGEERPARRPAPRRPGWPAAGRARGPPGRGRPRSAAQAGSIPSGGGHHEPGERAGRP